MSHPHNPSRTYATISLRKTRGRQKYRWAMRTNAGYTAGPGESYVNPDHALRMALRITGAVIDHTDVSDPAFPVLYAHNESYALRITGWTKAQLQAVLDTYEPGYGA